MGGESTGCMRQNRPGDGIRSRCLECGEDRRVGGGQSLALMAEEGGSEGGGGGMTGRRWGLIYAGKLTQCRAVKSKPAVGRVGLGLA